MFLIEMLPLLLASALFLHCVVQVVGGVGSGKSSVLGALIGHISKRSGSVAVGGRVAYVAQTAWITNGKYCKGLLSSWRRDITSLCLCQNDG
jgi:ABC-type uncharacterized transport system ATPase component